MKRKEWKDGKWKNCFIFTRGKLSHIFNNFSFLSYLMDFKYNIPGYTSDLAWHTVWNDKE